METEIREVERWCVVMVGFGDYDVFPEHIARKMPHVCGTFTDKKRAEAHAMFLDVNNIKRWR
jgi:uncharacterized short protein YbdD (DUF466 family)